MENKATSKLAFALKVFVALLAHAAVPAIVVSVVFTAWLGLTQNVDPNSKLDTSTVVLFGALSASVSFLIALALTAADVFILGLPLLLLGIRFHAVRWWAVLLAAFELGLAPVAWAAHFKDLPRLLLGGVVGMVGGLTFWLLWRFWVHRSAATGVPPPASS